MNMKVFVSPERMGELTCYNPLKVKGFTWVLPWYGNYIYPLPSMYGIFTYIYHILPLKTTIHVGKYTSPMDGMGIPLVLPIHCVPRHFLTIHACTVNIMIKFHGSVLVGKTREAAVCRETDGEQLSVGSSKISRWWQFKYFLFSSRSLGK